MRKFMSIILCASLLFSTALSVSAADPENVPSRWAQEYVDQAADQNIFDRNEMSISYQEYIDRESYCELAYNTLEQADRIGEYKASAEESIFIDTQNEKVYALNKMGIIKGKGQAQFAPEDSLTREEAATILFRMLQYTGYLNGENDIEINSSLTRYSDDREISDWAYDAVYEMLRIGIMIGTGTEFEPENPFTGEQAITTLVRIMELISGSGSGTSEGSSFAYNMYSLMPQDQNYMFSPLSIKMALAMMANGASGETKSQILDATDIKNIEVFNKKAKAMISSYTQSDVLRLNVANSMWINSSRTDLRFSEEYESTLKEFYNAESGIVTSDNAADRINGWVNQNTNGKIPEILDKNNTDFWSMIVNAVYFKGRWASEFIKEATKPDTFTDRNGRESQIDFMKQTSYLPYDEVNGITIVELPYCRNRNVLNSISEDQGIVKDASVSMFLMMSDGKSFDPESTLAASELSTEYVRLSVPKFSIEYSAGISDLLQKLGIEKAFTQKAEFQGMYDHGNMYVSDAIHKTYIKVDEEGTEAAAVTGVSSVGSALPPEPVVVKFDKPFTFVIMDKTNKEILFMGEYAYNE